MYFIDKLALRAGNEKDADEAADTVGCCSLRVEHISESFPTSSPPLALAPLPVQSYMKNWMGRRMW